MSFFSNESILNQLENMSPEERQRWAKLGERMYGDIDFDDETFRPQIHYDTTTSTSASCHGVLCHDTCDPDVPVEIEIPQSALQVLNDEKEDHGFCECGGDNGRVNTRQESGNNTSSNV